VNSFDFSVLSAMDGVRAPFPSINKSKFFRYYLLTYLYFVDSIVFSVFLLHMATVTNYFNEEITFLAQFVLKC